MDGNPTGTFGYRIEGTVTASGYRYGGTAVGEPLGSIWGYKVAGFFRQTNKRQPLIMTTVHGYRRSDGLSIQGRKDAGDFEWVSRYGTAKTADGKEQIDGTDLFLIGNVMPHSIGGINNTINWKRFTFNIYFDYALGHSIYNYMKTRMMQNTLGYSNANIGVGCSTILGESRATMRRRPVSSRMTRTTATATTPAPRIGTSNGQTIFACETPPYSTICLTVGPTSCI